MRYFGILVFLLAMAVLSPIWGFQSQPPITVGTPTPIHDPYRNLHIDAARNRTMPKDDVLKDKREQTLILAKYVDPLYRDPTEHELQTVAIDPSIRAIFSAFLAQPDTGIIKLTPDLGCRQDPMILSVSDECRKFPFPGAGNAYSFRTKKYRMRTLADLTYSGAKFSAPGELTQGIFVRLGDAPIESVGLSSRGVSYLVEYKPSNNSDLVATDARKFQTGTTADGITYASTVPIEINTTYGLRSIAYRGTVVRSVEGAVYNELDYDQRSDVIVVFRTVGFEANGNLIILWKKLRGTDAPKLKS